MILFHREAFSRWNMYLVGVIFLLAYDNDLSQSGLERKDIL